MGAPRLDMSKWVTRTRVRSRLGLPPGDSAIVSVAATGGLERLQASGIRISVRADAVRVSFHLHNTDADVDAVAPVLGR